MVVRLLENLPTFKTNGTVIQLFLAFRKHLEIRKPNCRLEIYKVFQDRLTFLNRLMIV